MDAYDIREPHHWLDLQRRSVGEIRHDLRRRGRVLDTGSRYCPYLLCHPKCAPGLNIIRRLLRSTIASSDRDSVIEPSSYFKVQTMLIYPCIRSVADVSRRSQIDIWLREPRAKIVEFPNERLSIEGLLAFPDKFRALLCPWSMHLDCSLSNPPQSSSLKHNGNTDTRGITNLTRIAPNYAVLVHPWDLQKH